ncbi:unnamed protein product [Arabis nemorensis]|uniref:Uncharacterized protein n=1 Tax=Arabis nemorensis TaxID=586526 RepID=A0A565CBU5_9BRAS|nr:unnamed protein product [Arabis nemorensis]
MNATAYALLITFNANCKRTEDSWKVLGDKVHEQVVVWSTLWSWYCMNNKHEDALNVFFGMLRTPLTYLQDVDLSGSGNLKDIPDLSTATYLKDCASEIEKLWEGLVRRIDFPSGYLSVSDKS